MNFTTINLLFVNLFLGTFILSQDLNSFSEIKVLKKWSKEFISGVSFPIIKKEDKLITPLLDGNLQILDFKTGERINQNRIKQAVDTQAKTVAAACNFCNIMLEDGVKTTENEDNIRVLDIAEMVAEGLKEKRT